MSTQHEIRVGSLSPTLSKLIEVIEEENATLRVNRFIFHTEFTNRKNHALRDLMAMQRLDVCVETMLQVRPLLERLSTLLEQNASLLRLHISAAGEISDIIVASLRDAESDGTYTRGRRLADR